MKCVDCTERCLTGEAEVFAEYCEGPIPLLPDKEDKDRKQMVCPALLRVTLKGATQKGYIEVTEEIIQEYKNGAEASAEKTVTIDLSAEEEKIEDDRFERELLGWQVDEAVFRATRESVADTYHTA